MTQEAETAAMDLNIVSCQTCDALFIESERRQTCPRCGGPAVGPYFEFVLDGGGLPLKDGAAPAVVPAPPGEEPAPEPEAPAPEAPAAEAEPVSGLETLTTGEVFPVAVASFLESGAGTEEDLRGMLADLGAEPEAAAIAVGRLTAVRNLLRELAAAGVEEKVVVEVEGAGEPVEPPPSEPESGPESV